MEGEADEGRSPDAATQQKRKLKKMMGKDEKKRRRMAPRPRIPSALLKELDLPRGGTGGSDDRAGSDAEESGDVYAREEGVPEEDAKKNRRFDPMEDPEYELPADFEGEDLPYDEEVASNGYVSEGSEGGEEDEDGNLKTRQGITGMLAQAVQGFEEKMALAAGNPEILAHQKDGSRLPELNKVDQSRSTIDYEDELLVDILLFLMLGYAYNYYMTYVIKERVYEEPCRGHSVVHEMVVGHWKQCYTTCRMYPDVFQRLCNVFRERGLLESSRHVSLEEQMRIFLQTLAHNQRNSNMCDILHHSSQTVSKHFNRVLNAFSIWACDVIKPRIPLEDVPSHLRNYANGKYWPYFRGCVGAIDGTHVSARVPKEEQLAYRSGRDAKRCTQNVLAICDFDMRFTFVVAGWEGTAHDAKILSDAMHNPANNFPIPPGDKYYLVDAGFPNRKGFLAPYKNVRYHVPEYKRCSTRGKDEQFNKLHSSLKNVIERTFGLLKRRWSILNDMPSYSYVKQVKIVVACMTIHNFLVEMKMQDELYEDFADEDLYELRRAAEPVEQQEELEERGADSPDMAASRDSIRDEIAQARGYL